MNRFRAPSAWHFLAIAALLVTVTYGQGFFLTEDKPVSRLRGDKLAIAPIQGFVGKWKGTGLKRRGTTKGSWRQDSSWSWKFEDGRACLEFSTPRGRYLRKGEIRVGEKPGLLNLDAELPTNKGEARYQGRLDNSNRLVVNLVDSDSADAPARISLGLRVDGKRLVVLYEGQNPDSGRHFRLGEVGYTQSGVSISKGSGHPECIVTGGRGTISVDHQGKSYTVCCKGCLDAFKDDPNGILAEWTQRVKSKQERKNRKNESPGRK